MKLTLRRIFKGDSYTIGKLHIDDRKEIMDWQLATFQTDYDPWKNPWMT